jgi:hypothetical protein
VFVFGFAFSRVVLERQDFEGLPLRYAVGPILQQGWVSAIAPYESSHVVHRVLLDVRTSLLMHGAPVIDPGSNLVIGLHFDHRDNVTASAIPLSTPIVENHLAAYDAAKAKLLATLGSTKCTPEEPLPDNS